MRALVLLCIAGCFSKPSRFDSDAGPPCVPQPLPDPEAEPPYNGVAISATEIAAGGAHACAIRTGDRSLWCWGENSFGQLGPRTDATGNATGVPGKIDGSMWILVAAGHRHTCAIRSDNKVFCWGANDFKQSGAAPGAIVGPTEIAIPEAPSSIYAGGSTSCMIATSGRAYCWGRVNIHDMQAESTPTKLSAANDNIDVWLTMSIGETHACAISIDTMAPMNSSFCWGRNDHQQFGGTSTPVTKGLTEPVQGRQYSSIAVGPNVTCGVRDTLVPGALECSGEVIYGHLGMTASNDDVPQKVVSGAGTDPWLEVAVGERHVCGRRMNGSVHCYGRDASGALGRGVFADNLDIKILEPTVPNGATTRIVAGNRFSCALVGTLMQCWGGNDRGQLGQGTVAMSYDPIDVAIPLGNTCETIDQLTAGTDHTCARTSENRIFCWGRNDSKQASTVSNDLASARPELRGELLTHISAGDNFTCGIQDETIFCWGDNNSLQLASPIESSRSNTIGFADDMPWSYVAAGSTGACGITSKGDLYCWGAIPGENGRYASPKPFGKPNDRPWRSLSIGSGFAIGVVDDGDKLGIAGFGDACETNEPISPASPARLLLSLDIERAQVAAAHAFGGHVCIHYSLKDGTTRLTCAGSNLVQQAGSAAAECVTQSNPATPGNGWGRPLRRLAIAGTHSCAIDARGELFCWGANNAAELGTRQSNDGIPTRVHNTEFEEVTTGGTHTCGVDLMRKRVSCWGSGYFGQLGNGTQNSAIPVAAGLILQ